MLNDSIKARPIKSEVCILPAASGCLEIPSTAFETAIPWPIPHKPAAKARANKIEKCIIEKNDNAK